MDAIRFRSVQRFFVGVMCSYSIYLGGTIFYRSMDRTSLLSRDFSRTGGAEQASASAVKASSALHLQDFHRVEVKNGRRIWEVRAKDAKYYAGEAQVNVSDAEVHVFQGRGGPLSFRSRAGTLHLSGDALSSAELEGNVYVQVDKNLRLKTEVALYDSVARTITSPGQVHIEGEGFVIEGEGLALRIDDQVARVLDSVSSAFETGARVPKGVSAKMR